MNSPILESKLLSPSFHNQALYREQLINQLSQQKLLTSIVAPAGYGKTILVRQWQQQFANDDGIQWLTLDNTDSETEQFLKYFTHLIGDKITTNLANIADTRHQDIIPYLTRLSNAMLQSEVAPVYLVLDNYHLIQNKQIHDIITFFLLNPIPSLRFIILSRCKLPFNLTKLRLQKHLTEITARDLCFQPDEINTYLSTQDFDLTPSQLQAITEKTQGWIACLEILILRLKSSSDVNQAIQTFSGTDSYLVDYFLSEFYDDLPQDYQKFLIHTSILNPLSGELCDAALDQTDSHKRLIGLEDAGLPIATLDTNRTAFQYHPLYREFLLRQFESETPEIRRRLHHRASDWYAKYDAPTYDMIIKALDHANSASQDSMLNLLEHLSPTIQRQGHNQLFLTYLEQVDYEILLDYPTLFVSYLWAMYTNGQVHKAYALLDQTEHLIPSRYQSELYALRTQLSTVENNPQKSKTLAQQTLTMLSPDDLILRGLMQFNLARLAFFYDGQTHQAIRQMTIAIDVFEQASHYALWSIATDCLIAVRQRHGSLLEAEALCRYAITTCEQADQPNLIATFYSQLGKILYERNYLQESEQILRHGRELSRKYEGFNSFLASSLTLARIVNATEAKEIIDETRDFVKTNGYQLGRIAAFPVSHLAQHGWISPHINWDKLDYEPDYDVPTLTSVYTYLNLARRLSIGHPSNPRKAITLLLELEQLTSKINQRGSLLEVLILLSLCYQSIKDTDSALFSLQRALLIAQHTGHQRLFLDLGKPILHLLEKIAHEGQYPEYALQLINGGGKSSEPAKYRQLSTPLTQRENDILRLLGEGYSNPEISHYFDISVSTIRWHVKNIYRKLDVNNRTRATVRARDLGLI